MTPPANAGAIAEAPSLPSTRAFRARVVRAVPVSPLFVRVTFGSAEFQFFGSGGFDQRIKVVLPLPDGSFSECGMLADPPLPLMEWYPRWRLLADECRNPIRTYTVRAARPERGEVDVDFVLHGDSGPASRWAGSVTPGDEVLIVGPDARSAEPSGAVEWRPGAASRVLLAGDETAAPAICAIIESLDPRVAGHAFIEVPDDADVVEVASQSAVQLRWMSRGTRAPGTALIPAIEDWATRHAPRSSSGGHLAEVSPDDILWDIPAGEPGEFYAWLAGEAGVITGLRRYLVRDRGVDRRAISFMGYWRAGRAES